MPAVGGSVNGTDYFTHYIKNKTLSFKLHCHNSEEKEENSAIIIIIEKANDIKKKNSISETRTRPLKLQTMLTIQNANPSDTTTPHILEGIKEP